jgi:hypothetical protein
MARTSSSTPLIDRFPQLRRSMRRVAPFTARASIRGVRASRRPSARVLASIAFWTRQEHAPAAAATRRVTYGWDGPCGIRASALECADKTLRLAAAIASRNSVRNTGVNVVERPTRRLVRDVFAKGFEPRSGYWRTTVNSANVSGGLMVQGLVAVVASLIGAVAAVALGVWFTLSKIRQERGYDRRLAWCESMMAALTEAGIAVTSAAAAENAGAAEECWTETIRAYERLIPLAAQRDLYAPLQGVQAIGVFLAALRRLIQAHSDGHRLHAGQPAVEVCLGALQRAANSLVELARDHLGLEKLPEGAMESETRFAGSFRGHDLGPHRAAIQTEQK